MLKKLIVFIFLIIGYSEGYGQDRQLDSTRYAINYKGDIPSFTQISFKISTTDQYDLQAGIGIRDKKNKMQMVFQTDTTGRTSLILYDVGEVAYVSIEVIGYDKIIIPVKKFKHKNVEIIAHLKAQGTTN